MKKVFWTLLAASLAFAACDNKTATTESEPQAVETVTGGDIAFVRIDYVLAQSEIYKTEGVALQEKNLQYEAAQLQEKYSKGLVTTADAQKQQQAIEKKVANYQTNAQKEAQTLDEENYVFTNRTQDLLMRAIKEINADHKYKLVLNATSLLDAAEALDISEAVLAKVNELYAAEKNDAAKSEKK